MVTGHLLRSSFAQHAPHTCMLFGHLTTASRVCAHLPGRVTSLVAPKLVNFKPARLVTLASCESSNLARAGD